MHSFINISNLAARGAGAFFFVLFFPCWQTEGISVHLVSITSVNSSMFVHGLCTWFLLSVSKWVQWGAHGTLPFNILTLFQQEGDQTSSPWWYYYYCCCCCCYHHLSNFDSLPARRNKHQAHGTFQILTLFWQGANIKPFPPKIEICWLPLVS